ncbi:MAG: UDP-N-acetylmuramoyl-tripeptide--D-alanyl-D-alanine ligase [bacterium]
MKQTFKKIVTTIITAEAKLVLKKYKPHVVAITGSVGKTSTKDAVYTVFSSKFSTRKSDKSFNSEIGIPLTILGCPNGWNNAWLWIKNIFYGFSLIIFKRKYPEWLVLEVGADRPGDIEKVSKWLQSDSVVFTRFGEVPVHVEYFNSREEVVLEKSYLINSLKKEGTLILNADDEDVFNLSEKAKTKVMTYGEKERADVVASHYSVLYTEKNGVTLPSGIAFKIDAMGSSAPVTIDGVLGQAHVYPLLGAATAGLSQNINLVEITSSFAHHQPPIGRMNIIEGNRNSVIIDDTYNSSPVALNEALETLKSLNKSHYKIAVLGDMLELGKFTTEEHKKAGKKVADIADILVTVGLRSQSIAEGALDAGMSEKNIFQFENSREAGKFVDSILEAGDIVLVKGSQGTRMEKTVEEIMAHPEDREKLLVRQDPDWKKR